jgi:tartrate-resistant acid phosphatase type 5
MNEQWPVTALHRSGNATHQWSLLGHWKLVIGHSLAALVFSFTWPASVFGQLITFAAIGDFGSDYVSTKQVAGLVRSWRPDFVLTLGDNNYPSGSAATIDRNIGQFYHEFIGGYHGRYGAGAVTNRFFPCLGNHDWVTDGAKPYLDYFTLPGNERYYTFRRGPVDFFCLDSDAKEPDGTTPESVQGRWLQQQLTNSTAPWKLVYFHHAPFSSGTQHGTHTGETKRMNWPFREWGASVVLAGHDHIYERIHTNGLVYFVNGLGGDSRDKFHTVPVPGSVKRYSADFGAMRVQASEKAMLFLFMNRSGSVVDSYQVLKPEAGK